MGGPARLITIRGAAEGPGWGEWPLLLASGSGVGLGPAALWWDHCLGFRVYFYYFMHCYCYYYYYLYKYIIGTLRAPSLGMGGLVEGPGRGGATTFG